RTGGGARARVLGGDRRPSPPDAAGGAARGRPAVTELLRLHGLALAAVGNRIEQEVRADGVDVHQVVAAVGRDAAVTVEAAQLALFDLVDAPGRDPGVLGAVGDRRNAVAGDVVAVLDVSHDVARVAITTGEDGVRHPDERHHGRLRRLVVAVGRSAEERGRLTTVHEAAEDPLGDVDHPSCRRALVIVAIVTIAGQPGV